MAKVVGMGAVLQCSMGVSPCSLIITPEKMVDAMVPGANIGDGKPMKNVPTFGMCNAKANPTVIAATAAAMGAPTPGACIPVTPAPWAPGSPTVMVANMPVLNDSSKLLCTYGGSISVTFAGETAVDVP